MNAYRFLALAAALVSSSLAVAAAQQPALAPTGPWQVDWAASQCVAGRAFGAADKKMDLLLRASPIGKTIQLLVVRSQRVPEAAMQYEAVIEGGSAPIKANMLLYAVPKTKL